MNIIGNTRRGYSSGNHRRGVGRQRNHTTPLSTMEQRTAAIRECRVWMDAQTIRELPSCCAECEWEVLCPLRHADIREVAISETASLFFHLTDTKRQQALAGMYPSHAAEILREDIR